MSCKFQLVMSLSATFWGHSTVTFSASVVRCSSCGCSTPLWTFLDCRQFFITYEKLKNVFWLNFTGIILSDPKFHYSTDCQCTTSTEFIQYYIKCTTISVHDSCMVIIIKSSVYYTGYATSTASHGLSPGKPPLVTPPITTSMSPGRVATKHLDRAVGMCPMICQESIDGS